MHLIPGSTWFQIVNVRLASLEWILCDADLATELRVGAKSLIATGPFWRG